MALHNVDCRIVHMQSCIIPYFCQIFVLQQL